MDPELLRLMQRRWATLPSTHTSLPPFAPEYNHSPYALLVAACGQLFEPFWDECGSVLTAMSMAGTEGLGAFYDDCLEELYPPGVCGTFCNEHTCESTAPNAGARPRACPASPCPH